MPHNQIGALQLQLLLHSDLFWSLLGEQEFHLKPQPLFSSGRRTLNSETCISILQRKRLTTHKNHSLADQSPSRTSIRHSTHRVWLPKLSSSSSFSTQSRPGIHHGCLDRRAALCALWFWERLASHQMGAAMPWRLELQANVYRELMMVAASAGEGWRVSEAGRRRWVGCFRSFFPSNTLRAPRGGSR